MAIVLRPEHEKLIAEAMQTGAYRNPEEVISRALAILHSEDEWLQDNRHGIHDKIERAWGQVERGECLSAEESRENMEARKAVWLAKQKR